MGRGKNGDSLGLESSMNMQARVMTFEEYLRHSKVIDNMDDERRKKSFNLNKWNENMQKNFLKKRKKLYELPNFEALREGLQKLEKEIVEFNAKFIERRKEIDLLEVEYERLDDENSEQLLSYVISCREKLRIENNEIETRLIEENLKKKRGKL
ncbi:MAG: hypothetical protein WBG30_08840 [Psychrilyobacter sp.]|uniref:hypothetical protein n=1 Tax=Psychrilyobacter sp. TaxID=2586924 RepID=UPI003C788AD2